MTDDPGLTTDEKEAFEALWDVLGGRHGGAHHAMILMRTAARAAVQTRVEALETAIRAALSRLEAGFPMHPDDAEVMWLHRALIATEQGGSDD